VFAVGASEVTDTGLPSICLTGFLPDTEVELWVTDPDSQSELFSEVTDENGTAIVSWPAETALLEGTYTFEATQDDLTAIGSVDVGPVAEAEEVAPKSQGGEPSIEVNPVGDSGSYFEVALSGFEPNQDVQLTLSVATDETGSDFEEIDWLFEQVDEQGETTFPLEIAAADWPSSLFTLSYWPEDGEPISAEFQVE
jgi:hypothetical protein